MRRLRSGGCDARGNRSLGARCTVFGEGCTANLCHREGGGIGSWNVAQLWIVTACSPSELKYPVTLPDSAGNHHRIDVFSVEPSWTASRHARHRREASGQLRGLCDHRPYKRARGSTIDLVPRPSLRANCPPSCPNLLRPELCGRALRSFAEGLQLRPHDRRMDTSKPGHLSKAAVRARNHAVTPN